MRVILPSLIDQRQTTFIQDRHTTENFLVTREILQQAQNAGSQAVFLKIDFTKAFNSVNWHFLLATMEARGFPQKWIVWMRQILATASSRVLINGEGLPYFTHKRGLRQGDPLSPMLFIIAVDVLRRMFQEANSLLQAQIMSRIHDSILALQYADDMAVVAHADVSSSATTKLILRIFAKISGLEINFSKSSYTPFNLHSDQMNMIHQIHSCRRQDLPVTYLGMPLTVRKPERHLFIPLLEKLEKKLAGWKGKLISRGGRPQLVNAVLSSIPIYFMGCFKMPIWVINRIDKIRRHFLWGKRDTHVQGDAIAVIDFLLPEPRDEHMTSIASMARAVTLSTDKDTLYWR